MKYQFVFYLCMLIASVIAGDLEEDTIKPESRILGGEQKPIFVLPYQVAIYQSGLLLCSGSIIRQRWILTAAQCITTLFQYPSSIRLTIRAGSANQLSGGVVVNVSQYYLHPSFNENNLNNDIALLNLEDALDYNESVQPVHLPERYWKVPDGVSSRVGGWGSSESLDQTILLRVTEVFTIPNQSCQKIYGDLITNGKVCAGFIGGQRDFCAGDIGSPLVINSFQYGIASDGQGCGPDKNPGIYTNVISYLDFIWDTVHGRS